jgi:hypothetical protein
LRTSVASVAPRDCGTTERTGLFDLFLTSPCDVYLVGLGGCFKIHAADLAALQTSCAPKVRAGY